MIRVLLVDDHAVVRTGFRLLLQAHPDITVAGEADSGESACQRYLELTPDVVVMDLGMPGMGGLEALRRIRAHHAQARVLALSAHDDPLYARRALREVWTAIVAPGLIVLGLLTYLATNLLVLGDAFAFISVQREHWSHSLSAPWVGFREAIQGINWRVPWEKLTVGGGEAAGGIAAYATTTLSWLRLRPSDAAYATVLTVMMTFLPFWLSIPRYLLGMYPLFLLVGRITQRWIYLAMVAASFIGLLVFGLAFGRGYWAF